MEVVLAAARAAVQSGSASPAPPAAPDSVAVAVRGAAPRIDGRLDDPVWARAIPIANFTQREPVEGQPGTVKTEVRIVLGHDALYFGIEATDPEPGRIMAPLARRDERPVGDWVGVMLDSYHDRRTAFEFAVNPAGVKRDVYRFNDFEEDVSWDAAWEAATTRHGHGWSAELRIPLSQLRFPLRERIRFGFNVYREIGRTNEVQYWRLLPQRERGVVSRFGDLIGLDGLERPDRVELSPFVVARSPARTMLAGWPATTSGLGLRFAVAPNVSLSAAVNPDFGEVEADPAVVNLGSQEVFLPERRPLFVDGADFFRFSLAPDEGSSDGLLYTRRIGRTLQSAPGQTPPADGATRRTTILAATKVVAKTSSGWSLGLLSALTARERDPGTPANPDGPVIEPRTQFWATRVSRDVRGGNGVLSAFGALVRRDLPPELTAMTSSAVSGGLSGSIRFGGGRYLARGLVAGSQVRGPREAITALQQSPVHYFQRPDMDYATVDTTLRSLVGHVYWWEVARDRGALSWTANYASTSPGLEVNDAGYLPETGRRSGNVRVRHSWLTPARAIRRTEAGLNLFWNGDYDWRVAGHGAGLRTALTFPNYSSVAVEAWRNFGGTDAAALRGGPALMRPPNYFFRLEAGSGPNRTMRGTIGLEVRPMDEGVSHETRLKGTIAWRPSTRLDLEVSPALEWNHQREQYVATGQSTITPRYVVGRLRQRTLRTGARASFAFAPEITLQGYVEPFATNGSYSSFGEVSDAGARRTAHRIAELNGTVVTHDGDRLFFDLDRNGFADLGIADPDFSVASLRSTMIFRWEYRSGSVASLVLQHGRSEAGRDGDAALLSTLHKITRAPGSTALIVKISYWFST